MGKELKLILLILLGILVIVQFIPSGLPGNSSNEEYNFIAENNVPVEVAKILTETCYDCHSQEVKFPWYSYVAPVSWQIATDVNMGREHLDFSNWQALSKRKKIKILGELSDEVSIGEMPLRIYKIMHREANLTKEQREELVNWADNLAEKIMED
jgi:hypothetical protein